MASEEMRAAREAAWEVVAPQLAHLEVENARQIFNYGWATVGQQGPLEPPAQTSGEELARRYALGCTDEFAATSAAFPLGMMAAINTIRQGA